MGNSRSVSSRLRGVTVSATVAALLLTTLVVASPASADTAPPTPDIPITAAADVLPTAQVNGVVWDQVIIGNTVYAGGNFTSARPAGAPAGTGETARTYLLSYNLTTGLLNSWAPVLNGQVRSLTASPDGTRLYVVGAFTNVNGVTKNRIVAFDTTTGAIITSFAASANAQIYSVAASESTVYFSGEFSQSNGVARPGRAAAALATTGATTAWAPVLVGGRAYALEVSPDRSKVVLAGNFTTLNGSSNPGYGLGAVTADTGTLLPWLANDDVRNAGDTAAIYNLTSDATGVYGTGFHFGGGGNTEGSFRMSWADGDLTWVADCSGDEYSIAVNSSAVYIAGHPHNCNRAGGFPQTNPWSYQRALAWSKDSWGANKSGGSHEGEPAPRSLNFFPTINAGTFTGQDQGPWSVSATNSYVVYAGEFTEVNGIGQQGLVRFAMPSIAPNDDGPRLFNAAWPLTATATAAGTVTLSWPANWDRDNELLTYNLIRNGNTAAPVYTTTGLSQFWDQPSLGYVDTGLTPGASYTYRVIATDAWGNAAGSSTVTATAGTAGTISAYARDVISDGASLFFRLDENSGTAITNAVGPMFGVTQAPATIQQVNATAGNGVNRNTAGAIVGDSTTASSFNGTSNGRAVTTAQTWPDDSSSVELWFRTSASSGKMLGFGSSASVTGNSSNHDFSLFINGGRLNWSVYDTSTRTIQSGTGVNDNQWHHAVGTVGRDGMKLYLDGALVATRAETTYGKGFWGNWKIGGDATPAGTQNFNGSLDEVAVYKTTLSASAVAEHYTLGTGGAGNTPPTASFTTSASDLTASVNAAGSNDPDGTIASYAWNFGDGSTGSGVTASRTYAAAGTYTVTLTVTDNGGATAITTRTVTVTQPAGSGIFASDPFTRTVSGGWGSAPLGGAWTATTAASSSVNGSAAQFNHAAGTTRRAYLSPVAGDSDVTATISVDKAMTGGGAYAGLSVRQVGSDFYQARIRFLVGGSVNVQLLQGTGTTLATGTAAGITYTPGQQLNLRLQATGSSPTTLRAKVWVAGSAEPSAWNVTTSNSAAALQGNGAVGTISYVSGSITNAPLTVSYDDFVATSGVAPPPVNAVPTASFTTAVDGLIAAVDGSASSDTDGSIVSYAWNFGDGSTGTGATASRTYAAGGTYTVTLTVTDNGGATGTTTRSVTVAPIVVPGVLASDAFDRTVATGWGSATIGGAWSGATTANYSVNGSVATSSHAVSTTRRGLLSGVSSTASDTTVEIAADKAATGGGYYAGAVGRQVGTAYYQARIRFVNDGSVAVQLLNGSSTVLSTATVAGISYTPGTKLTLRLQVTGTNPTTIRAKVWLTGGTEPAAWQVSTTDSTAALQVAGSVGLESYVSGSSTNAPIAIRYDNYSVLDAG